METVLIEQQKHYLMMMVKLVRESMCKDNKEAEASIVRLCMECFEHGVEFERNGKVTVCL